MTRRQEGMMAMGNAAWIVGVCGAAILSGCGSVDSEYVGGPDADMASAPDAMPGMSQPNNPGTSDAGVTVRRWYKLADGIEHPGEVPGLLPDALPEVARGRQARRAGVVIVEWCDRPGKEATVCKWDGPESSTRDQAWAECDADSRTVCGTIKYPQVLFY